MNAPDLSHEIRTDLLMRRLDRARAALEWYANKANYSYSGFESIPGWWDAPGLFAHDCGDKAREALEEIDSLKAGEPS